MLVKGVWGKTGTNREEEEGNVKASKRAMMGGGEDQKEMEMEKRDF